ncbi:hypothetical protein JJB98_30025 [Bradyrhizobium diazoefficiens]|nr:hypothetical protein [Bradyrhizobium diazoefficiens]QQO23817.1 hypothetical protein JJB98_30025 [Bradyrhizobium diazoefficiens]
MLIEAAAKTCSTLFGNLRDCLKGIVDRRNELQRLDEREIEVIARELNLSRTELAALIFKPSGSLQSLSRRLSHAGLAEDDVEASHGDVLRDLRRVCSQCASKARCARDVNHARQATPAKYCPNEQTLRALADDVQRCAPQNLPVPATRN